ATSPPDTSPLSLHDALPASPRCRQCGASCARRSPVRSAIRIPCAWSPRRTSTTERTCRTASTCWNSPPSFSRLTAPSCAATTSAPSAPGCPRRTSTSSSWDYPDSPPCTATPSMRSTGWTSASHTTSPVSPNLPATPSSPSSLRRCGPGRIILTPTPPPPRLWASRLPRASTTPRSSGRSHPPPPDCQPPRGAQGGARFPAPPSGPRPLVALPLAPRLSGALIPLGDLLVGQAGRLCLPLRGSLGD